jgi:hypothetical protein
MAENSYRIENRLYEIEDLPAEGKELQEFVEKQRRQIEPWLSAIFQSEHLALLVGSGFSIGLTGAVGATSVGMTTTSFLKSFDPRIIEAAIRPQNALGAARRTLRIN